MSTPAASSVRQSSLQGPGIAGEVFLGAKLGWVYEDRDCHRIAACLRGTHQGQVSLVQGSHGGHQPQGLARRADPGARAPGFSDGLQHQHALGLAPGRAFFLEQSRHRFFAQMVAFRFAGEIGALRTSSR